MLSRTSRTVTEDGTTALTEAVYYRHFVVYRAEHDSIEEAKGYLCYGEEEGTLASVGVFVDGEPVLTDVWLNPHPPTDEEAAEMREDYAKAGPVC